MLDSTSKVLTDKIRVNEAAQEITFRSVKGGGESTDERDMKTSDEDGYLSPT